MARRRTPPNTRRPPARQGFLGSLRWKDRNRIHFGFGFYRNLASSVSGDGNTYDRWTSTCWSGHLGSIGPIFWTLVMLGLGTWMGLTAGTWSAFATPLVIGLCWRYRRGIVLAINALTPKGQKKMKVPRKRKKSGRLTINFTDDGKFTFDSPDWFDSLMRLLLVLRAMATFSPVGIVNGFRNPGGYIEGKLPRGVYNRLPYLLVKPAPPRPRRNTEAEPDPEETP